MTEPVLPPFEQKTQEIPVRWMAVRIAAILFFAEFFIMISLPGLKILANPWLMLLFDSLLLSLIAATLSHKLVFLPLLVSRATTTVTHHMQRIVVLGTILAKSTVVIFTVEAGIMLVLRLFNTPHEGLLVSLINAMALTLAATPVMIYWIAPGMKYGKKSRISQTLPSFLTLLIPTGVVFISVVMAFYHSEVGNKREVLETEARHHLSVMTTLLRNDLATVAADLHALSRQSAIPLAMTREGGALSLLQTDWTGFLEAKRRYPWILLSDAQGGEILYTPSQELDHDTPAPRLPDLRPVLSLDSGALHVFPPGEAMTRQGNDACHLIFSTPVFFQGDSQRGLLSLGLFCQKLYQHLLHSMANYVENVYLINEKGAILFSHVPEGDKPAELSPFSTLQPTLGHHLELSREGQLRLNDELFTFGAVTLTGRESPTQDTQAIHSQPSQWHLVTHLPLAMEERGYVLFRENTILLSMVMLPVLMVGVWLFVNTVVKWNRAEADLEEHARKLEQMVSERTRQLVRADRLATLGAFSSGMAHEINDPNAFIAGNVHFLKLYWEKAMPILDHHKADDESGRIQQFLPEIEDILEGILTGSQRISRVVEGLKSYTKTKPATLHKELCRLRTPVENALRLLRQETAKVRLALNVPEELVVFCDPQELTQAFVHMFRNALEAMAEQKEKKIAVTAWVEEKGVCIRFQDNGPEIPPDKVELVFDPFFTGTNRSQGFDLSLPIVQGIVEQQQGKIEAMAMENGAAFHIHLPIPGLAQTNAAPNP